MAEIIAIAVLVFIHRILVKAFQGFRSEKKRRRCGYPVNRLLEKDKEYLCPH